MERFAWKAKLRDGMLEEYTRRHDEIWPEMIEVLKNSGIYNYTIWTDGYDLFGYYECEKGVSFATAFQKNSPVVDKWNAFMKDVMIMENDPITGAQPTLRQIFYCK